jgi:hypothetical protein
MSRWLQTATSRKHTARSSVAELYTVKMEALRSSETSVHAKSTRRHIPEDGILLYNDYRRRGGGEKITKRQIVVN